MVLTTKVFTPTKPPTHTSVRRKKLWKKLSELADQGGALIPVLGVTKLGKTTLITDLMQRGTHFYIPSQQLTDGASALWSHLATKLDIPVSKTTGTVVGDKSQWKFFGRFGVSIPGTNVGGGAEAGGQHSVDKSSGATYDVEPSIAVTEAMALLAEKATAEETSPPLIVLDDFHFLTDMQTRREIVVALRPVMEKDVTVILASLPGRQKDPAYETTNLDGRLHHLVLPAWDDDELREIATRGFETLNVVPLDGVVDRLIAESYGSPQIMQQLCLNLCRMNNVRDDKSGVGVLDAPDDWREFFREIEDSQSISWLNRLGLGLKQRGKGRNRATLPDGREFDGYQLILWAIHQMGSPAEVSMTDVTSKIADLLGVSVKELGAYALDGKVANMNTIASREMDAALEKYAAIADPSGEDKQSETASFTDDEIAVANLIPQPVFEASGDDPVILRILNPLLAYALTWHPESFESPRIT